MVAFLIAPKGHAYRHLPHLMHFEVLILDLPLTFVMAPTGQEGEHRWVHPWQLPVLTV
jgi:hypothetical protein